MRLTDVDIAEMEQTAARLRHEADLIMKFVAVGKASREAQDGAKHPTKQKEGA